jgi:2'-5' RNA ligase
MRLFLAVEIPAPIRKELRDLQAKLKNQWPGWRWVRPEGIHLTLRFLGEVGAERDALARNAWNKAATCSEPFVIRLGGIGRFPRGGRARVLWVGIEELGGGTRLDELAARVETAARESGFEPEKRAFRPHLTLARALRGARPAWQEGLSVDRGDEFSVDRLVLFRSQLHPSGARYTALDHFMLKGGDE